MFRCPDIKTLSLNQFALQLAAAGSLTKPQLQISRCSSQLWSDALQKYALSPRHQQIAAHCVIMLRRIFVLSILCLARRCQAVPEGSGLDQGATEDFSFGQAAANCSSDGGFLCGDLCTATFCRCGDATLTLDSDSRCCVEEGAYCSRGDTGDVVCATGYSASKTESCSPDTEGDRLHQSVLAMSKLMYNMFANKSRDNFVFSPLRYTKIKIKENRLINGLSIDLVKYHF